MKITYILTAALMAAGIGMSGAAAAQMNNGTYPPRGDQQMDQRSGDPRDNRGQRDDRHDMGDNRDMRDHRDDRGRYGRDDRRNWGHGRQHCRTEWRHHRRVRICR